MRLRRENRRGVILLVSLILLVLFLLLGITFVLTASNWQRSMRYNRQAHEHQDNSDELLDSVLLDFLRGGADHHSPFRYQNLLEDLYGEPSLHGRVTAFVGPIASGQFMSLALSPDAGFNFSQVKNYYSGLVITMISGNAKSQSRRIVSSDYLDLAPEDTGIFNIVAFDAPPDAGDLFVINGRPFSGTGLGFDLTTGQLDPNAAQQPNLAYFVPTGNIAIPGGYGGLNEGYDAADFNNPWLAVKLPGATNSRHIKPSWHDPKLMGSTPTPQTSFRPLTNIGATPIHPAFTGSNPSLPFDPINGPWDVDNDRDGIPDSIWMDAGLPVQSLADGRLVKPLVAMLVLDLDGRVNINTHGTARYTVPGYYSGTIAGSAGTTAGGQLLDQAPSGSGFGPAEINPAWVLGDPIATNVPEAELSKLLFGSGGVLGRYADAGPGVQGVDDVLSRRHLLHTMGGPGATWPDIRGDGVVAVDVSGWGGFFYPAGLGGASGFTDDPYEQLVDPNGFSFTTDEPFNYLELESILRATDIEAGTLTQRLLSLSPQLAASRDLVTTSSWDLPVYSLAVPSEIRTNNAVKAALTAGNLKLRHLTDLVIARMLAEGVSLTFAKTIVDGEPYDDFGLDGTSNTFDEGEGNGKWENGEPYTDENGNGQYDVPEPYTDCNNNGIRDAGEPYTDSNGNGHWDSLIDLGVLSVDMLAGLRLNVNQLLGNGLDDNGNGVIDEPGDFWNDTDNNGEIRNWEGVAEYVYSASLVSALPAAVQAQFNNLKFDHNRDGEPCANPSNPGWIWGRCIDPVTKGASWAKDMGARQQYAQQLYFLLMLLADKDAHTNVIVAGADETLSDGEKKEIFARRLAQFAVNAVDFRDRDMIMTPFEYDENPFNGWDPNAEGDLSTAGGTDVRVVWGAEAPTLLLSEATALHNRGTKDDDTDWPMTAGDYDPATPLQNNHGTTSAPIPDPHYDQARLPVGSLFLELYCAASPYVTANAAELFTAGQLDLDRIPNGSAAPVWRVAISEPHTADPLSERLIAEPNSLTFQIEQDGVVDFNLLDPSDEVAIDRIVWFTNIGPPALPAGKQVYYNRTLQPPDAFLSPGEYLVIGPRQTTVISQLTPGLASDTQYIKLNGNAVEVTNPDDSSDSPIQVGVKTMVCAADPPNAQWDGSAAPDTIGLSVSEPLSIAGSPYYKRPGQAGPLTLLAGNPFPGVQDYSYVYTDMGVPTVTSLDVPFDTPNGMPGGAADSPVGDPDAALDEQGTQLNFCTAFLQRLANPLLPWNPVAGQDGHNRNAVTNPYVTVDWIPIDLTVYNRRGPDPAGTTSAVHFRSRERGKLTDNNGVVDVNDSFNIWQPAFTDPSATAGSSGHAFPHDLVQSLGFLNHVFDLDGNPAANHPYNAATGKPLSPFPWLTWKNGPYDSQYELMQVPAAEPGLLNAAFSNVLEQTTGNSYDDFDKPYMHLLNFFHSDSAVGNSAQLGRVFDYLHVPSPYLESRTVFNPNTFASTGLSPFPFHPPHNVLSTYREPGRINLNTIYNKYIWQAVMNGPAGAATRHPGPNWATLLVSRRGYDVSNLTDVLHWNDPTATPSFFALPFRAAANRDLTHITTGNDKDIDNSLLRSLFLVNDASQQGSPMFTHVNNPEQDFDHTARNSYFRYQPMNRLGNLVTTRSNVYAIWITLGYFEVEAVNPPNPIIYPDGYRLGAEVNTDTGEIKRHRSFYIIDRTIPVGYERGQDHNVEDVIQLRRRIE